MSTVITVFVRHAAACKYKGDEFYKRCDCGKHLRWTVGGKQFRRSAKTGSWADAELSKRSIEDQLAGKDPETKQEAKPIGEAVQVFIQDKAVQGVSADVIGKYTRELARLQEYCEKQGVYTVKGITRELLSGYSVSWEAAYPSTQTRAMVRARCRGFLRFCYESEWIPRIPLLPKIRVDVQPTLPLSPDEYERLLAATTGRAQAAAVRALFQLMRFSGLAVRDALTLERAEIHFSRGIYRVVTSRQKTGTDVSVPLPPDVAAEVLAVTGKDPKFIFWDGESDIVKSWTKYTIAPVFKAAKLDKGGNMMSHRLRDTFAVELLQKGVPLEEVSKLLGHTSIKTTEKHYAKWMKGRQDRLDALVTGSWDRVTP
jgi:integrase/recombinase XerD